MKWFLGLKRWITWGTGVTRRSLLPNSLEQDVGIQSALSLKLVKLQSGLMFKSNWYGQNIIKCCQNTSLIGKMFNKNNFSNLRILLLSKNLIFLFHTANIKYKSAQNSLQGISKQVYLVQTSNLYLILTFLDKKCNYYFSFN